MRQGCWFAIGSLTGQEWPYYATLTFTGTSFAYDPSQGNLELILLVTNPGPPIAEFSRSSTLSNVVRSRTGVRYAGPSGDMGSSLDSMAAKPALPNPAASCYSAPDCSEPWAYCVAKSTCSRFQLRLNRRGDRPRLSCVRSPCQVHDSPVRSAAWCDSAGQSKIAGVIRPYHTE